VSRAGWKQFSFALVGGSRGVSVSGRSENIHEPANLKRAVYQRKRVTGRCAIETFGGDAEIACALAGIRLILRALV
jgi:hypothetical protein